MPRPSKFKKEFLPQVKTLLEDQGFTIAKLASFFNVSRSTIYYWIDSEKEFSDVVTQARKAFDGEKIYNSLVKRATGYKYTETTKALDDKTGELVTVKAVKKEVAPDVAAIKHWQTNRDPEHWSEDKEKPDYNLEVTINNFQAQKNGQVDSSE